MNSVTTPASTALAPSTASAGALLMDMASMDKLERLADLMASGKATVPAHLKGNKGDCFAISLQSMQWGMNPFTVAQKTHLVNGTLGYEAQLVAAVINSSGIVKDRFNFEWFGDWDKIVGKFKEVESKTKKDDNGFPKKYIVPAWNQADEQGLGIKVWATLRGESQPRLITLLLTQARTRNSTLWTEDPKQQLAYLAQKRWARLYAPDVILGVYTTDEMQQPGETFMGMAEVVEPGDSSAAPTETASQINPSNVEIFYPQPDFDKNLDAWAQIVASGRKTLDAMVVFIQSKGKKLTPEQINALAVAAKQAKTADAEDATVKPTESGQQAGAPHVDVDKLAADMQNAPDEDRLYELATQIDAVADPAQKQRLNDIFDGRNNALKAQQ
ncbi:RecT family [Comamonas aquatica]|uniref:RecT family n=2 Tax=Comamonas aquatica TaxID=225991 RepID=A0AA35D5G3_9BURK|nr:RecT family [Comamonas aquatica]CAC9686012.1 RecT family [Comamonas aquatica]